MAQFCNTKKVTYDFLSPGVSKKLEKNGGVWNYPKIFFEKRIGSTSLSH